MARAIIVINSCWPYSGRQFAVLVNGTSVLQTDDLNEAKSHADALKR